MTPSSDGGWKAAYRGGLRLGDPEIKINDEALRRPFFVLLPVISFLGLPLSGFCSEVLFFTV